MNIIDKIYKNLVNKEGKRISDKPIAYRKLDLTHNYDEDEEPILFI